MLLLSKLSHDGSLTLLSFAPSIWGQSSFLSNHSIGNYQLTSQLVNLLRTLLRADIQLIEHKVDCDASVTVW